MSTIKNYFESWMCLHGGVKNTPPATVLRHGSNWVLNGNSKICIECGCDKLSDSMATDIQTVERVRCRVYKLTLVCSFCGCRFSFNRKEALIKKDEKEYLEFKLEIGE